jgi:hypothetical protein
MTRYPVAKLPPNQGKGFLPTLALALAQDYFSFFNHAELSVDGGAVYLVKFLKAFAAARAPLRIVAVFDNDTAGLVHSISRDRRRTLRK